MTAPSPITYLFGRQIGDLVRNMSDMRTVLLTSRRAVDYVQVASCLCR